MFAVSPAWKAVRPRRVFAETGDAVGERRHPESQRRRLPEGVGSLIERGNRRCPVARRGVLLSLRRMVGDRPGERARSKPQHHATGRQVASPARFSRYIPANISDAPEARSGRMIDFQGD